MVAVCKQHFSESKDTRPFESLLNQTFRKKNLKKSTKDEWTCKKNTLAILPIVWLDCKQGQQLSIGKYKLYK